jgi:hypothetical protein
MIGTVESKALRVSGRLSPISRGPRLSVDLIRGGDMSDHSEKASSVPYPILSSSAYKSLFHRHMAASTFCRLLSALMLG